MIHYKPLRPTVTPAVAAIDTGYPKVNKFRMWLSEHDDTPEMTAGGLHLELKGYLRHLRERHVHITMQRRNTRRNHT